MVDAMSAQRHIDKLRAPITVTFQVEGDKVVSFTLTQGSNPGAIFTRVEGK